MSGSADGDIMEKNNLNQHALFKGDDLLIDTGAPMRATMGDVKKADAMMTCFN